MRIQKIKVGHEDDDEEELVVVAEPAAATTTPGAAIGGGGEERNCSMMKFKIEIEPGLFRRCYVPYNGHQDLFHRLGGADDVHYYKDDANHWTIVDNADDIPGMLDVFQDQEVIQLCRFRPPALAVAADATTTTKKQSTREQEQDTANAAEEEEEEDESGEVIRPTDLIKILCEAKHKCLDIGSDSVREVHSAVRSNTTLFRIRRLDGPSQGVVKSNHIVGLFSRDNKFRLDIGGASVYKECDATHNSWATLLHIRRADDDDVEDDRPLQYEELVGVFSSENDKRLDIGRHSMMFPCMANNESWASRLHIAVQD